MSVKTAASKAKGVGYKVGAIVLPLATALPVFTPSINALMTGGPRGWMNHVVTSAKAWGPPGWNTVTGYIDGPGGAAIATSLVAKLAKWGIKAVGLKDEIGGGFYLLVNAVEDWGDGSAFGYAVREILYPTASTEPGLLSGVGGVSGLLGQPATGSPQEMRTKDQKPKARLMWV